MAVEWLPDVGDGALAPPVEDSPVDGTQDGTVEARETAS